MGGAPSGTDASSKIVNEPSLVQDTLAGLTVAFSLLSKAIACSAIVGVNPLVGIWSSVVMGITAPLSEFLFAKNNCQLPASIGLDFRVYEAQHLIHFVYSP
jgi:hypothetical protein